MTVSQALKHFLPDLHEAIQLCEAPDPEQPDWPDIRDYLLVILSFLAGILFSHLISQQ